MAGKRPFIQVSPRVPYSYRGIVSRRYHPFPRRINGDTVDRVVVAMQQSQLITILGVPNHDAAIRI